MIGVTIMFPWSSQSVESDGSLKPNSASRWPLAAASQPGDLLATVKKNFLISRDARYYQYSDSVAEQSDWETFHEYFAEKLLLYY